MQDTIADMLIRIKNGYLARKKVVEFPHSKMKESLTKILVKTGYLENVKIVSEPQVAKKKKESKEQKIPRSIIVTLKYEEKIPALTGVKRVSKPGLRIYAQREKLPQVLGGLGVAIISTSQGLMTDKEAREKGLGGEVICKIW